MPDQETEPGVVETLRSVRHVLGILRDHVDSDGAEEIRAKAERELRYLILDLQNESH